MVGIKHGLDRTIKVTVAGAQAQRLQLGADVVQGVQWLQPAFKARVNRAFEFDPLFALAAGLLGRSASQAFLRYPAKVGGAAQFFKGGGVQVEVLGLGLRFEQLDDQQVREGFHRFHGRGQVFAKGAGGDNVGQGRVGIASDFVDPCRSLARLLFQGAHAFLDLRGRPSSLVVGEQLIHRAVGVGHGFLAACDGRLNGVELLLGKGHGSTLELR